MRRTVFLSPVLLGVVLSPAFMQFGSCNPATGDATLSGLEVEVQGQNHISAFDPGQQTYNVWLPLSADTAIVRAYPTDPDSEVTYNLAAEGASGYIDSGYFPIGGGEVTLAGLLPEGRSSMRINTRALGGARATYSISIQVGCGDCDDGDDCTSDVCNTGNSTCEFTTMSAGTLCDAGGGPGTGQCDGAGACPVIDPFCLQVFSGTVPTACRDSVFNEVTDFPLDMTVAVDRCVYPGQPFNATVTPTMSVPIEELQPLADTLCAAGTTLTEIQIDTSQALVDALAGATCTPALSELNPVPQIVPLDVTVNGGGCGVGGASVTVNAPVSIPLPAVPVSCVADAGPGPVAFCADGTTPGTVLGTDPPVDTYLEILVAGGIPLDYACSPGVASADGMSVDPIDPTADCLTLDACTGVDCSDGNPCTQDVCDAAAGGTCSNPPGPPGTLCDAGGGPGTGQCDGAGACPPIDPSCLQPVSGSAPTACRNSFDQRVRAVPVDMTVAVDRCLYAGQPFDATVTPAMALDMSFLDTVAQVLCDLGIVMDQVEIDVSQASIDALAGATCTPALSELSPVPQIVAVDVTVSGTCGAGGIATVNSVPLIPLPQVALSCIAGSANGPAAFCADGTTPLSMTLASPPVQTFVGITVAGGVISAVFQCGGAATTIPAPGATLTCTTTNADGGLCGAIVGTGDFGETPFPTSDCNFSNGFPGECEAVPVALDPATDCVTFPIACVAGGCDDGNECTNDVCNTTTEACEFTNVSNGTSCEGGIGTCQSGTCVDNCAGVNCDDANPCTLEICDSAAGGTCSNPPGSAGNLCDAGGGPGTGQCDGFGACPVIDPQCLQPVSGAVPTACRSSFNGEVLTFPVDMTIALDRCVYAGHPFDATVTPTMTITQEELDSLAQVFCPSGTTIDEIRIDTSQALIDALVGANCTPALSELSPVPEIVPLDVTLIGGGCEAGGGVTVNSPVLIPLPPVLVSCVADAGPGPVAFCADGTTPGTVFSGDSPVDTYMEIVAGFFIDYACSAGVASADAMSVDPIDPAVDCITFPFVP